MKETLEKYITEQLKSLKYKGDSVKLENVYPDLIEEVIGGFNAPYELNGYDCDYWASTNKYNVSGCMRFGTAKIELLRGREKPTSDSDVNEEEEYIDKEQYYIAPEGSENWPTFYFSFGHGHEFEGWRQPIKALNMSLAWKRMFDVHQEKWAFNYTEEDWNTFCDRYPTKPLDLLYGDVLDTNNQ